MARTGRTALPLVLGGLFAALLCAPGPSALRAEEPPARPAAEEQLPAAADLTELEKELGLALVQLRIPGAAVALTTTSQTLLVAGLGKQDGEGDRTVQPSTPFAAGPLGPLLVALVAGRAEARTPGLLDRPFAPAEAGLLDPGADVRVTLEQLLEQTAGVDDLGPRELQPAEQFNAPLAEVLARGRHAAGPRPGSFYFPSRPSITAAALYLEKQLGSPFAELAESELFEPLHLTCSSYRPSPGLAMQLAPGQRAGRRVELAGHQQWPAEGPITCAQDLVSLLQIFLGRGRVQIGPQAGLQVIPGSLVDRMHTGTQALPGRLWVSGPGTRPIYARKHVGAGVSGSADGASLELAFFADAGVGYAVLLPIEDPVALAQVAEVVRGYLLGRAHLPALPPRASLVAGERERLAGTWEPVLSRNRLRALFDQLFGFLHLGGEADELWLQPLLGQRTVLWPAGGGALRLPDQPQPAAVLVPGPDGDLLVTAWGTFRRAGPWPWVRIGLLGLSLLLLGSTLLFALFWVPRALLGGLRGAPDLRMRAMPLLAALVLAELCLLFNRSGEPLGTRNLTTVLLALLGVVFGALALTGLFEVARAPQQAGRALRRLCLAQSLAATWVAALLWSYGLLGVRTWAL
jgi:CubicO group peptidase (beta-lactamase class C family)